LYSLTPICSSDKTHGYMNGTVPIGVFSLNLLVPLGGPLDDKSQPPSKRRKYTTLVQCHVTNFVEENQLKRRQTPEEKAINSSNKKGDRK
jgi:hypothetical protein